MSMDKAVKTYIPNKIYIFNIEMDEGRLLFSLHLLVCCNKHVLFFI